MLCWPPASVGGVEHPGQRVQIPIVCGLELAKQLQHGEISSALNGIGEGLRTRWASLTRFSAVPLDSGAGGCLNEARMSDR